MFFQRDEIVTSQFGAFVEEVEVPGPRGDLIKTADHLPGGPRSALVRPGTAALRRPGLERSTRRARHRPSHRPNRPPDR